MAILPGTVLAHEIALEDCASIIDSYGVPVKDKLGRRIWYDVDPNDSFGGYEVARAMRYLEARNLLRRHPKSPNRVRVIWP